MSDQPPRPIIGQTDWGDDLNAYLAALDARLTTQEGTSADLDGRVTVLEEAASAPLPTPTHTFRYNLNSSVAAPPASGQLRLNNTNQQAVTTVWLHNIDQDSQDVAVYWSEVVAGSTVRLYIQDRDDSTRWVRYTQTTDRVDQGTYQEIPVSFDSSSGVAVPTQQVGVVVYING
jgi:hypothetical protein